MATFILMSIIMSYQIHVTAYLVEKVKPKKQPKVFVKK